MVENFVSISAVTDRKQLEGIGRIYREDGLTFPVAIGYQASNRSISQGAPSVRQPRFADLSELDKATRELGFVTAVHYYTPDNATILSDLEKIAGTGINPSITLLQFNTLPPSREILRKIKEIGFRVIFKVTVSDKKTPQGGYSVWKGDSVQDVSDGQVEPLVNQVEDRKDFIEYAMFDPSHGTNLDLNLDEKSLAARFGRRILASPELKHIGLVYAGGIKPGNVRQVVRSLSSFFPGRFSIDTESGVRTNDKLDLELVRSYLLGCREGIECDEHKKP